jgi:hypothetical protein
VTKSARYNDLNHVAGLDEVDQSHLDAPSYYIWLDMACAADRRIDLNVPEPGAGGPTAAATTEKKAHLRE